MTEELEGKGNWGDKKLLILLLTLNSPLTLGCLMKPLPRTPLVPWGFGVKERAGAEVDLSSANNQALFQGPPPGSSNKRFLQAPPTRGLSNFVFVISCSFSYRDLQIISQITQLGSLPWGDFGVQKR